MFNIIFVYIFDIVAIKLLRIVINCYKLLQYLPDGSPVCNVAFHGPADSIFIATNATPPLEKAACPPEPS